MGFNWIDKDIKRCPLLLASNPTLYLYQHSFHHEGNTLRFHGHTAGSADGHDSFTASLGLDPSRQTNGQKDGEFAREVCK